MMKSKSLYILVFLLLSFVKVFSQEQTITNPDIVTNAKIFFLNQDTSFYTNSQALYFLNDTSNYELLSSKGFGKELVFIKIKIRGNFEAIRKEKIADSLYEKNRVPFSCDYIIACKLKGKKYYRLKGFASNDFLQLFTVSYKKNDRAFFLNRFWIDELDLACLFDSYFMKRKSTVATSCLQSCSDRDRKFVQIKND
ncbi:MAG TPA: hypothetical protein PKC30_16955 [Saprospiraceae bacterium]|nr:hypothetical protein [Ferruginibacter sp.]HMQ08992.1 hypothetical protein [Saprospiraceae bacterium]